ncbi:MAG: anti-phage-associated DUF3780 domain-containing protein [Methylococcales bacterium]
MTAIRKTIDFGCPNDIDPHHFVVHIPAGRSGDIIITEHFGLLGGTNGVPESEVRAVIPRAHWRKLADTLKRVFNERLKVHKLGSSRWKTGDNKVERLLGKELCILAWGMEHVELDYAPVALNNWLGFKPEERWWLFSMTAASSGKVEDSDRGWRQALGFALMDGEQSPALGLLGARPQGDGHQVPLPF